MNVVTQMFAMLIALAIAGGFGYAMYIVIDVLIDGLNSVSDEVRVYVLGGMLGLVTAAIVVALGLWRLARSVTLSRTIHSRLGLYRRIVALLLELGRCPTETQHRALMDLKPQMLLLAAEQALEDYLKLIALLDRPGPLDDELQGLCRSLMRDMRRDLGMTGADVGGDAWESGGVMGTVDIDAARSA